MSAFDAMERAILRMAAKEWAQPAQPPPAQNQEPEVAPEDEEALLAYREALMQDTSTE